MVGQAVPEKHGREKTGRSDAVSSRREMNAKIAEVRRYIGSTVGVPSQSSSRGDREASIRSVIGHLAAIG